MDAETFGKLPMGVAFNERIYSFFRLLPQIAGQAGKVFVKAMRGLDNHF